MGRLLLLLLLLLHHDVLWNSTRFCGEQFQSQVSWAQGDQS